MSITDKLNALSVQNELESSEDKWDFGPDEEKAAIALLLNAPELWDVYMPNINYSIFTDMSCQYVMAQIKVYYKQYEEVPTRGVLYDICARDITVDDAVWDDIKAVISGELNARVAGHIASKLAEWIQHRKLAGLYSAESLALFKSGNYDQIQEIIEDSMSISSLDNSIGDNDTLLTEVLTDDPKIRYTTGIHQLDGYLNGGITGGQVLMYVASTGGGKSTIMASQAAALLKRKIKVTYVTLEVTKIDLYRRILQNITGYKRTDLKGKKEDDPKIQEARELMKNLRIVHLEAVVSNKNHINAQLKTLARKKHKAPIVIVDYLEQMSESSGNKQYQDYQQQKKVAQELVGLAQKHNIALITATQTNRTGYQQTQDKKTIDLGAMAGSYDKAQPMDYVISLSPSDSDRQEFQMHIAKNRHGRNDVDVLVKVDWDRQIVKGVL
jgi:archaellum biogenesis ATPase FlaH